MPVKPIAKLTASTTQILNTIRANASDTYRQAVPTAVDGDIQSLMSIGQVLTTYEAMGNEFIDALVNRIGLVVIKSRLYENPWNMFKRGFLEYGETIEEIFVNIANVYQYQPETANVTSFQTYKPDVLSAFHKINMKVFYPVSIRENDLKLAFLSWNGVTNLIARIVDSLYTAANYDEFNAMKYLIATHILQGHLTPIDVEDATAANGLANATAFKETSNNFTFMSKKYNMAGVLNYSDRNDQFLIMSAAYDAINDVNVLASAFNMDKAEFLGHRVIVDSFGTLDTERLNIIFNGEQGYTALTPEQLTALDTIPAVLVDRDFFMVFDNLNEFRQNYLGAGLQWNYFFHVWKTLSISPFENAAVFTPTTPTATAITVTPAQVTGTKGQNIQFSASVTTTGFAPQSVTWTIENAQNAGTTISANGLLHIDQNESAESITVKAISTFNTETTGTATVTLAGE